LNVSLDIFSVCVYCGSRTGLDQAHARAAREVGAQIGQRGWQLVYGGGKAGLMGVVADAVLEHGGRVIGVIPRILMEREVGHRGLHELHVVETMHQRKQMMAERARAFLAMPGGIGTLEELFEVWTWRQIGYHDQPVGLLNVGGYYDALLAFLQRSVDSGFLAAAQLQALDVDHRPQELLDTLHRRAAGAAGADDYARI
jgi:uncharacterized protein (TIGR00730 family)